MATQQQPLVSGTIFYEKHNPLLPLMVVSDVKNDDDNVFYVVPRSTSSKSYCTLKEWNERIKWEQIVVLYDPREDDILVN